MCSFTVYAQQKLNHVTSAVSMTTAHVHHPSTSPTPPLAPCYPMGEDNTCRFIGFPCSNFSGYCDFFNQCMIVDNDGALNRLANFFLNSVGIQQAIDWITRMWWVAVIVIVGVLVIMFVIVIIFHMVIPRPKYRRKANKKPNRVQQRTVPMHGAAHSSGYKEFNY